MKMSDVLVLSTRKNTIDKIFTNSYHKKIAKIELNEVLAEHPEWFDTIYTLSILPLLIWANEEKKKHPLSRKFFETCNRRYGSSHIDNGQIRKIVDGVTGILCSAVNAEDGMGGKCLRAIFLGGEDVSCYMITTYFAPAVKHLCEKHAFVIENLFGDLRTQLGNLDEESRCVFHDIESIFLVNRESRWKKELNAEETETRYLLLTLVKALESCEVCDKETRDIVSMYIKGSTEVQIREKVGRSRDYVRARIGDAKKMFAVYLWGLTTNDVLSRI